MGRIAVIVALAALIAGVPTGVFPDLSGSEEDEFLQPEPQDLDRGRIVPCCYSLSGRATPVNCQLLPRRKCYRLGGTVVDGCFNCPIWDFGGPKLGE